MGLGGGTGEKALLFEPFLAPAKEVFATSRDVPVIDGIAPIAQYLWAVLSRSPMIAVVAGHHVSVELKVT